MLVNALRLFGSIAIALSWYVIASSYWPKRWRDLPLLYKASILVGSIAKALSINTIPSSYCPESKRAIPFSINELVTLVIFCPCASASPNSIRETKENDMTNHI